MHVNLVSQILFISEAETLLVAHVFHRAAAPALIAYSSDARNRGVVVGMHQLGTSLFEQKTLKSFEQFHSICHKFCPACVGV
jgi:hypothetical protein